MAVFGLHVLGATIETWGKTSPHGTGYTPSDHRTPGHYAPRQNPEGAPLGPRRTARHEVAADRPVVRVLYLLCFTTKWVRGAAATANVLRLIRNYFHCMEWAKPCLATKGNRNGISWVEFATAFMFFHNGLHFRRISVFPTTAIWVGSDHAEFSIPNLAQMATERRIFAMATRKLFGSIPPGHPWQKTEWTGTRSLATAGFTVSLPGLAS